MKWRFQPVWLDEPTGKVFVLCEVYFDDDGTLSHWTDLNHESSQQPPVGNDIADLTGELTRMLVDAYCWIPVAYSSLRVGMTFEPTITAAQRESLARMVDSWNHNISATRSVTEPEVKP